MRFPLRWPTSVDSYVYHVNVVKMYSEGRQDTITLKKKERKKRRKQYVQDSDLKKNIKPYISHVIGTAICITLHINLTKLKYKVC